MVTGGRAANTWLICLSHVQQQSKELDWHRGNVGKVSDEKNVGLALSRTRELASQALQQVYCRET